MREVQRLKKSIETLCIWDKAGRDQFVEASVVQWSVELESFDP